MHKFVHWAAYFSFPDDMNANAPRDLHIRPLLRSLPLIFILFIAALLRFSDLNWDQSQYNHPDERHVTNVISGLRMPDSLSQYFDSAASPLNPYNMRQSWVYGTLPLFSARLTAEYLDKGCGADRALLPWLIGRALFPATPSPCPDGFFTAYDTIRLVGRMISALADTLTVLAVYLTGRRWFGRRAGLLAAAFSCLAVLQIQHAKFFVVESLLTSCTAWCLYFCARLTSRRLHSRQRPYGLWADAALAGVFSGLAVACKISVWPTAVLVVFSIGIALWRDRRAGLGPIVDAVLATLIAGVVTFAGFRIAQPYGFVGNSAVEWQYTLRACDSLQDVQRDICQNTAPMPENVTRLVQKLPALLRPVLAPSARWVSELQQAAFSASGQFDPPFGWQWANRAPITFPLGNIIFYGLGIPLALAALLGILYFARQMLRGRRRHALLVPLLWIVGFFLYQGTQYVKSIRYQLPIDPMLSVIAAAFLVAVARHIALRLRGRGARFLAAAPAALVLGGTLLWTIAFMQIYRGELTRTEATRWIYENVPTAVSLEGSSDGAARSFQLPVINLSLTAGNGAVIPLRLSEDEDGLHAPLTNMRLRLNKVSGSGSVHARLTDARSGRVLTEVTTDINSDANSITLPNTTLDLDGDYMLNLDLQRGGGIVARTSVIGNQHWDEGLPFRLGGKDGYGAYYRGLSFGGGEMQVYAEEDPYIDEGNPGKMQWLLRGLDEADVLVLNSNRHYGSVARLPWRFPMTNRYYETLMSGKLGFELVADFYRFPQLGPFVFNDQEMPQQLVRGANVQGTPPGIEVPYPKAEEAFSVYDHPRVLIFRKTADYSHARAEAVLGVFDLTRTLKRTAFDSSNTPNGLMLNAHDLAAQRAGGTWSELFPRSSPLNQSPWIAVLAWLALLEATGVAAFFLIAALLKPQAGRDWIVPDGGYWLGKIAALLLVAWTAWMAASLKIAAFERSTLIALVAALLGAGVLIGHLNRDAILTLIRRRWRMLAAAEVVFLFTFALLLAVRAGNPDLWHPYFGGEKPMDFAYFNSILKAVSFPPQDPWFAGGTINYYYFGWVLIGWPVKLLGIDPSVAYNIVVPTLFALTALGSYGAAGWLTAAVHKSPRVIIVAGLAAALGVVLLGNLQQLDVLLKAFTQLGDGSVIAGILKRLGGTPLPIGDWTFYWDATRPAPEVLIAEFPLFTFLYADLHAHMMAMPLALGSIGGAILLAAGALRNMNFGRRIALLAGVALFVGALWPANTWDYFPYLLLCLGALVCGELDVQESSPSNWLAAALHIVPTALVLVVLSRAFFAPYYESFGAGYNQIEPWTAERTQIQTYLVVHGLFLVPLLFGLLRDLHLFAGASENGESRRALFAAGAGLLMGAYFVVRSAGQSTPAWTSLISAPLTVLAVAAALRNGDSGPRRLKWLMVAGAMALTLFVEHFTLRGDLGRMNTQFKFYIAAWLLLGVAAAAELVEFLTGPRAVEAAPPHSMRIGLAVIMVALTLVATLYPITAIPGKMRDRYVSDAPRGLDGMAYMRTAVREEDNNNGQNIAFPLKADYDAIRWMQDNVQGSPTILEGTAGGNQYRWAGRFSIYTGLPSVVGWQWHQRQQRGESLLDSRVIYDRFADIETFYGTQDVRVALTILRRYEVRYVIVSPYERIYNSSLGFAKFKQMANAGLLRNVYDAEGVTIYEVPQA